MSARKTKKIEAPGDVGLNQNTLTNVNVLNSLKVDSTAYRVYANATVGGYTKTIEAVVNSGIISYWSAL